MQDVVGNARQRLEARRVIEIPGNRHHAVRTQQRHPLAAVSQSVKAVAVAQLRCRAQRHVAATDDQ
jgi:hypothetical protein